MTKKTVIDYIVRDIEKIKRERKKLKPLPSNEGLRSYLTTRQNTLMEIHTLLTSGKKPLYNPNLNKPDGYGNV